MTEPITEPNTEPSTEPSTEESAGATVALPWERPGGFLVRWSDTLVQVTLSPGVSLLPRPSVNIGRAGAFLWLNLLLAALSRLVSQLASFRDVLPELSPWLLVRAVLALLLVGLVVVLLTVVLAWLFGALFKLVAALFHSPMTIHDCVRSACYVGGVFWFVVAASGLLQIAAAVLDRFDLRILGGLVAVPGLIWALVATFVCVLHARRAAAPS